MVLNVSPSRRLAGALTAAWRTAGYGLASILLRGREARPSPADQRVLWQFWAEAFSLQCKQMRRGDVAQAVRQLERRDLWNLPRFVAALPSDLRRARAKRRGVRLPVRAADGFPYPPYYLHDFHNQANGGLSRRAAATYEWQIRMLFVGTNRLMRQGIIDALPSGGHLRVLDVGCGTAAWVPQARLLGRHHHVTGVDLSPHYLDEARRQRDPATTLVQGNAERLPAGVGGGFDRAVCIWLYHELPEAAQRRVSRQIARALKPGGELLFMDAIQPADVPGRDIAFMNQRFAIDFDEPYFAGYQGLDLAEHFASCGLELVERRRYFVSNLLRLRRRPGPLPRARRGRPARAR